MLNLFQIERTKPVPLLFFSPSVAKTFQALFAHFLVIMVIVCHLRTMLSDPGYVAIPHTKIDFSSDVEKVESSKKVKVRCDILNILPIALKCL